MTQADIIIGRCEALYDEGLSVSSICIEMRDGGGLTAVLSINTFFPLGEGGDLPRHKVTIDRDNCPAGVTIQGWDRHPSVRLDLAGNAEQAEAIIREVARRGQAQDWTAVNHDLPSYPHFLTKPRKWFRGPTRKGK